jgi:hypothetical protein
MRNLRALARFTAGESATVAAASCELCSAPIGEPHRHVVERGQRGVLCACTGCGILFTRSIGDWRYRTVPDRVRKDRGFAITRDRLADLGVPVSLAICYQDSSRDHGVVCYPGPAGLAEAELDAEVWRAICDASPLAASLQDDVEALLIRGDRSSSALECYLVPISTAYELVALLRTSWHGFTGGDRGESEVVAFFAALDRKGRTS